VLLLCAPGPAAGELPPEEAVVARAVDGDTARLADGRLVRYIGIDAPEMRRLVGGAWLPDPEPMAEAAAEANRRLVEGLRVRLEYDVELHDRYGRLLAYVYVGERMVNAALVEAGYAQAMTIPPNVKYAARFRELAAQARRAGRGLWAGKRR
jgi:micrococcal nuclease